MGPRRRWKARTGPDSDKARTLHLLRVKGDNESNELEAGEEVADFEGGGFRGVRAMCAVHLDAGAEIVANRAGRGLLWVSGAHGLAPFRDGAIGFEDHGEDFAGAHEVGKLAKERAFAMDGIETAGFFFSEAHGFDGN